MHSVSSSEPSLVSSPPPFVESSSSLITTARQTLKPGELDHQEEEDDVTIEDLLYDAQVSFRFNLATFLLRVRHEFSTDHQSRGVLSRGVLDGNDCSQA